MELSCPALGWSVPGPGRSGTHGILSSPRIGDAEARVNMGCSPSARCPSGCPCRAAAAREACPCRGAAAAAASPAAGTVTALRSAAMGGALVPPSRVSEGLGHWHPQRHCRGWGGTPLACRPRFQLRSWLPSVAPEDAPAQGVPETQLRACGCVLPRRFGCGPHRRCLCCNAPSYCGEVRGFDRRLLGFDGGPSQWRPTHITRKRRGC